eukprot:6642468-Ditylum_brightwellii.AAC.1
MGIATVMVVEPIQPIPWEQTLNGMQLSLLHLALDEISETNHEDKGASSLSSLKILRDEEKLDGLPEKSRVATSAYNLTYSILLA